VPQSAKIFTTDVDGRSGLAQLWRGKQIAFRVRSDAGAPARIPSSEVRVSKEPWGEATFNIPGLDPYLLVEIINPKIESRSIRFITPDVALVDAVVTYEDAAVQDATPLLLVLKKEGADWKIAAIRLGFDQSQAVPPQ
jgi:hypothetical protein